MRELREVFPGRLQKLWNSMQLRVLVLLSLLLQIVLISTGNRRKYIRRKWVGVIIWLCYLSADVVATIALGVLSQAAGDDEVAKSNGQQSYGIMGFWAPFLLMHLGGPDSITAYALEDNELWSRHFLGLVGQVSIAIYVLLRSWISRPINYVWFAVFAAGLLKYGERTVVLFWASRDQFRKWMLPPPDPMPNYVAFMEEVAAKEREGYVVSLERVDTASRVVIDDPREQGVAQEAAEYGSSVVQDAYPFFLRFRRIFADLILGFQDREASVSYFRALTWDKAFGIVEIELGLIYDLFYTKAFLLYSRHGSFFCLLRWLSTVAAFVAFVMIDKNAYPKTEVIITYILFVGAILIEIYAVMIFISSEWFVIWLSEEMTFMPELLVGESALLTSLRIWERKLFYTFGNCEQAFKAGLRIVKRWCRNKFPRTSNIHTLMSWLSGLLPARLRWSNAVGQYNVLDRCIGSKRKCAIIRHFWTDYFLWNSKSVPDILKNMIFKELNKINSIYNGHGELDRFRRDKILLRQLNCFEDRIDELEIDQSVLLWHLATDLCYHIEYEESLLQAVFKYNIEFSVLLSNYMVHLLITSPFMLPGVIDHIQIQDTCAEAIEFFYVQKNISGSEARAMLLQVDTRIPPSKVKGHRSKSLLFDACRLAKLLRTLEVGERWEMITQAWLGILISAAAECKWSDHAEKLSQGGELLTHVWLLMTHLGMTDQFMDLQAFKRSKLHFK